MSARRTVVVITSDPDGPVIRRRVLAFAPLLEAAGISLEIGPGPKGWMKRKETLARAERAGHAWVVSRLLRVADVERLRERVRRLLFDFDDALPFRDSARGAGPSSTRAERFRAIIAAADAVSAGNAYLARLASGARSEVRVLPTVVEVTDGPPEPERPEPPPVLGWIGSAATLPYLSAKTLALAAVVTMGQTFRLRVIADAFPTMPPGIPVDEIPWTEAGEAGALDGIHVGLAPLPDDPWTRGKCGLKVIQMLARGRPVVANAVGVQRDQVRHGITGFLAKDDPEFVDAILAMLRDPLQRRRMGQAAKQDARENWSVGAWGPRVVHHVESALA
jgi:hypothetical protein